MLGPKPSSQSYLALFILKHRVFQHLRQLFILVILFVGLAFLFIDQPLAQWMSEAPQQTFWLFNREITEIGEARHFFFVSFFLYILCRFLLTPKEIVRIHKGSWMQRVNWQWIQAWGLQLFLSLCFSGLVLHLIKKLVGRQRPHKSPTFDPQVFDPLKLHWDWNSFPSGHSQTLFTVLVFLILLWPRARWFFLAIVSYLAMTRAFTQAHFVSDVLAGGFIGYAGAILTLRWFYHVKKSRVLIEQSLWRDQPSS